MTHDDAAPGNADRPAFDDDLTDDSGDFATEHDETTVAGDSPGGPERAEEEESPRGRAGMD